MKKFYTLIFAVLMSIAVLVGCGAADKKNETKKEESNKTEQTESAAFPVTIKDAADKDVVIEAKPEKIVSLMPSNTEIAFALGLGEEIVGVSDNDNYPKEVEEKEKVGGMELNIEKIISLKPDLVLAHGGVSMGTSAEGMQQLRDAGITVLVIPDGTSISSVYDAINMVGKASGKTEEAGTLVADMKTRIDAIKEKASSIKEEDKQKVYIEVYPGPGGIVSAGTNTFMDEMLEIIHAENVVTEEGWPTIDQEAIIAANPDVIITTYGFYTEDPVGGND